MCTKYKKGNKDTMQASMRYEGVRKQCIKTVQGNGVSNSQVMCASVLLGSESALCPPLPLSPSQCGSVQFNGSGGKGDFRSVGVARRRGTDV